METYPAFLARKPNVNDFPYLADGGWDAEWYVGHNTAWVVKLPPAPRGDYVRAFLGAKLGRMKTESVPGRPAWERRVIKGEVDIGLAQEPLWPHSHRFLLARAEDIPLEGDPESPLEGVGESRWFWTEIPLRFVSFERDNWLVLFSPSESLSGARRAPILAAGARREGASGVWINSTVRGQPPLTASEALKTPVTSFEPALAVKLIPRNGFSVDVVLRDAPAEGAVLADGMTLSASVGGTDVQSAWVESSTDTRKWTRVGRPLRAPPYAFTLRPGGLPEGPNFLRVTAEDAWHNRGSSPAVEVSAPPAAPKRR